MDKKPSPENAFDSLHILFFIWKWKWQLIGAGVAGLVLSVIVSLMLSPEYESYTILFPSATTSAEKILEEQQFGFDIHAERLIQILDSDVIRDSITQKFNLVDHYEVDTTELAWKDQLSVIYHEKIQFQKTIYTSIVIRVRDENPQLAADIANEIARLVDIVRWDIFKANTKTALEVLENDYQNKQELVNSLRDSIFAYQSTRVGDRGKNYLSRINNRKATIRTIQSNLDQIRTDLNIYDYSEQMNMLNLKIANANAVIQQEEGRLKVLLNDSNTVDSSITQAQARLQGARNLVTEFNQKLSSLSGVNKNYFSLETQLNLENKLLEHDVQEYEKLLIDPSGLTDDPQLTQLNNTYTFQSGLLNELQRKYQRALNRYQEPIPATYLVSRAEPNYKKMSPNLPLNVALGTVLPIGFMVVLLLFWEKIKEFRSKLEEMK